MSQAQAQRVESGFESQPTREQESPKAVRPETADIGDISTTLDIFHTPEGDMRVELKEGNQVDVSYVSEGTIVAAYESKVKDGEVEQSAIASALIKEGKTEEAEAIINMAFDKTKHTVDQVEDSANVFARVFRKITSTFGRESIVQMNSHIDNSVAEGNASEIAEAIDMGRAFVIPSALKEFIVKTIREESNFGMMNSEERAVQNLFTGKERIGDGYIGIPLKSDTENPVYMYFMLGKTKAEPSNNNKEAANAKAANTNEEIDNNQVQDSSTVEQEAA